MNEELLMCAFLYSHCTAWYCMVLLGTVYCLVQPVWLEKKKIAHYDEVDVGMNKDLLLS